jgi:hypothetical protein
MRDRVRVSFLAAILVGGSVSAGTRTGRGDEKGGEKSVCIAASDQGQQLRDDGKFKLAREAFLRCARSSCPTIVSHDCQEWLIEVDARTPTVIVDATDEKGNDLTDVKVSVDGAPFVASLTGLPARVDPGERLFRYEADGLAPVEERVVVRTGEKNRVLKVRFSAGLLPPAAAPAAPGPGERRGSFRPPLASWVFTGTAVAAFASEAYFGIAGLNQRNDDLSGPGKCAPACSPSERSSIETKFAVADVSLGVGVVSAGLAVYFFVRSLAHASTGEASLDLTPRAGGGVATVSGRF